MSTRGAHNTWSVTKKELASYTGGATIYIVAIAFLMLWEFLFFRNVFLVGEASLRGLFDSLPWLFLVLVPALTMGAVSQERSEGTLELLLTHPVRDRELIAGKFVAATSLVVTLLLFAIVVGLTLEPYGNLDWGEISGQYLAAAALASVLVALGICVSAVLASQISALLVSAVAGFFLIVAGLDLVTARLPLSAAAVLEQLSALTHFESMSRGVVDLRDVWYIVSMVAVFLSVAQLALLRRRFGARKALYHRHQVGVALLVGIVVLTNIISARIPGRIDLTEGNIYTLSGATRDVVKDLDDVVNVTFYSSSELPPLQQPVLRDVKDMLRDYETIGTGNIVVRYRNTSAGKKVAQEAASRGVQEVQFNVVGDEEFKIKKGFFGIVVSTAGQNKAIPFVGSTDDLEYQLTSLISELTADSKPKIGFLSGHGEKDPAQAYPALQQELARQFDVQAITISKGTIPKDVTVLVVAGPTEKVSKADRDAIRKHIDRGGAAMFLVDRVTVNLQLGQASANDESLADLVAEYGPTVGNSIVYDLNSNLTASFSGGGGLNFVVPYALWPRAIADGQHPATRGLQDVALPWASPVTTDDDALAAAGLTIDKLLTTTGAGGLAQEPYDINPQQQFPQDDLRKQPVAVALHGKKGGAARGADGDEASGTSSAARIVVIGDSDLFTDEFLQRSPGNLVFGMQAMSWLGQEASLASIRVKNMVAERLKFEQKSTSSRVRWVNLLIAFVVPAVFGGIWLWRRRRLAAFTYTSRRAMKQRGKERRAA